MDILNKLNDLVVGKAHAASLGSKLTESLEKLEGDVDGLEGSSGLIEVITNIAVPLAVICVVVLVVYAGYLLISSQGNPDKIKEGKDVLTNAIIGFLVILLSVAILLLISNSLGLNIYN